MNDKDFWDIIEDGLNARVQYVGERYVKVRFDVQGIGMEVITFNNVETALRDIIDEVFEEGQRNG